MILNPRKMVEIGAVTEMKDPKIQIQPNGVDLRIGMLMEVMSSPRAVLDFDNSRRTYPAYRVIALPTLVAEGTYLVQYAETVTIPPNIMAQVIMRSSLQRMGARLFSSVYDSGYTGKGVGLFVLSQPIYIHEDARVGQIVFFDAESSKEYDGIHKGEGITKKIASGKPKPKPKPEPRKPKSSTEQIVPTIM
jgi:deoxycytidine triphosphate deaminase